MPAPRVNIEAEFKRFQERGRKFAHKSLKRWRSPKERELSIRRIIDALKYHKLFPAEVAKLESVSKPFVEQVMRAAGLQSWRTHRTQRALRLLQGGREFKRVAEKTGKGMSEISELAKKHGIENPRRLPKRVQRELVTRLMAGERPTAEMAKELKVSVQTLYHYKARVEAMLFRHERYEEWLRLRGSARQPKRELFPDNKTYQLYYTLPWPERKALREVLILQRLWDEYVKDVGEKYRLNRRLREARGRFSELQRGHE